MTPSTPELNPPNWPDEWVRALSDSSLKRASNASIFQRGKAYAASGAVEVMGEDPMPEPALHAQVVGTETYATDVWIEDDVVAGDCDCPNAAEGWFCKHQVAVALVWRDRLAAHGGTVDAPVPAGQGSVRRARPTEKERRQALRDFLCSRDVQALADKLLALADRDRGISLVLQQWHKATEADAEPAKLEPLIIEMLAPGRDFIAWNESYGYVQRAQAVLPLLQQARERHAGAALALCLHALRQAWNVLQQADDSDGDIGGLCQALGGEWLQSLQAAGPQPASFGDTYLQAQLDDPIGCLDAVAMEAAMGAAALKRYRDAIALRWRHAKDAMLARKAEHAAKVATRKGRQPAYEGTSRHDMDLWTLERLHIAQLESAGRVDEVLAVLREDVSEAHAHSQVISYLEKHERFDDALAQAERGIQAFPDDWRLQNDLLRCCERAGRTAEALALRRRQFERSPGVEGYHQVLRAGLAAGQDVVALRQSLMDFMISLETRASSRTASAARPGSSGIGKTARERDVSLRAEVLGSEGRWVEACTLVQPPSLCHEGVLGQIARHLPAGQKEQAVALLLRVFDSVMQRSSSPYRDALALVHEIGRRMNSAQRTAWLAQLRIDYKAKRNFIRDLPAR